MVRVALQQPARSLDTCQVSERLIQLLHEVERTIELERIAACRRELDLGEGGEGVCLLEMFSQPRCG